MRTILRQLIVLNKYVPQDVTASTQVQNEYVCECRVALRLGPRANWHVQ